MKKLAIVFFSAFLITSCIRDVDHFEFNLGEVHRLECIDLAEHFGQLPLEFQLNGETIELISGRYFLVPDLSLGAYKVKWQTPSERYRMSFEVVETEPKALELDLRFQKVFRDLRDIGLHPNDSLCSYSSEFEDALVDRVIRTQRELPQFDFTSLLRVFSLFSQNVHYDNLRVENAQYVLGGLKTRHLSDVFDRQDASIGMMAHRLDEVIRLRETLPQNEQIYPVEHLQELVNLSIAYNYLIESQVLRKYVRCKRAIASIKAITNKNDSSLFYTNKFYELYLEIGHCASDWDDFEGIYFRRRTLGLQRIRALLISLDIIEGSDCWFGRHCFIPDTAIYKIQYSQPPYGDFYIWAPERDNADSIFFQHDRWNRERFRMITYSDSFYGMLNIWYDYGFGGQVFKIANPVTLIHHIDNSGYNSFHIFPLSDTIVQSSSNIDFDLKCKVGNNLAQGYASVPVTWMLDGTVIRYGLTEVSGHDEWQWSFAERGYYTIAAVIGDWREEQPNLDEIRHVEFEILAK